MLKECVKELALRNPLSIDACETAGFEILQGADPILIAVFLALLHSKGERPEELLGLARALRAQGRKLPIDRPFVDLVGTGGDFAGTVNISTASALLTAACGVPVVKHGNRAVSSKSGSADLIEALGASLTLTTAQMQRCVKEIGFVFCFAPEHYPALKSVRPIRKSLGLPSAFNLLGPLLNPAGTDHLLIGVFDPRLVPVMAKTLQLLGTKRSLIFSGHGLDELSCLGQVEATLVTPEALLPLTIDPEKLGLKKCTLEDLAGGDAHQNGAIICRALSGEASPIADTLILNAAAALFIYGPATTLEEGVKIARETLQSGAALALIESYSNLTRHECSHPF